MASGLGRFWAARRNCNGGDGCDQRGQKGGKGLEVLRGLSWVDCRVGIRSAVGKARMKKVRPGAKREMDCNLGADI